MGTPAPAARKGPAQESLSRTRLGSGSDEGTAGKKVVTPRARRQAARVACARGVSQRRAAWLCTTPRSGIRYEAKGPRRKGSEITLNLLFPVAGYEGNA